MTGFSVGDMVVSLCGHDKGELLIVIAAEDNFVTVCDGKRRKADKKKRKKLKHVRFTGLHSDLIEGAALYALDAAARREIKRLAELI